IRKGTPRDHNISFIKQVAQAPIDLEAVGIHPEGDGGLLRIDAVHDLPELRAISQSLAQCLPSGQRYGLDLPLAYAIAKAAAAGPRRRIAAQGVENFALAFHGVVQPEGADRGRDILDAPLRP